MKEKKAREITLFHTQSPEAQSSYDPFKGLSPESQARCWKKVSGATPPMFLAPEEAVAVLLYRGHQMAQAHNETMCQKRRLEHLLQSVDRGDNVFMQYGDYWIFSYNGRRAPLLDHRKGFLYLAKLLKTPGKELKPFDLDRMFTLNMPVDQSRAEIAAGDIDHEYRDGGKTGQQGFNISTMLTNPDRVDNETLEKWEAAMEIKKLEIKDYCNMGDDVSRRKAERELSVIQAHVKKTYGTRNRRRPAKGDHAEKIRRAVGQAIQRAVQKISNEHKSLGKHLQDSVSTENGSWRYKPTGKPPDWTFG